MRSMFIELMKKISIGIFLLNFNHLNAQGFSLTAQDWNVPMVDYATTMMQTTSTYFALIDINGDGYPDLVDGASSSNTVWRNGTQAYWKVYLNNGTSISSTAQEWNIPEIDVLNTNMATLFSIYFSLVDINGDGTLDLIDARNDNGQVWLNGTQAYWKVYLNNGTSFSATAQDWNVPTIDSYGAMSQTTNTNFALVDVNGDEYPDLVDAEDPATSQVWLNGTQAYWKVYLNNGTSFSPTAQNWNVPTMTNSYTSMAMPYNNNFTLADIDGNGALDLIDAKSNNGQVWLNGTQTYWKVYLNNGTSFSATAQDWNVPTIDYYSDMAYTTNTNFALMDINGDGYPDLVDGDSLTTGQVWLNGTQASWRVYTNNGSSFSTTPINWAVPIADSYSNMSKPSSEYFTLVDMDGDGNLDLVDSRNNSYQVWQNGTQAYWKVYLNNTIPTSFEMVDAKSSILVYPNPTERYISIEIPNSDLLPMVYATDVLGKVFNLPFEYQTNKIFVDLKDLNTGVYILSIQNEESIISVQIVKM